MKATLYVYIFCVFKLWAVSSTTQDRDKDCHIYEETASLVAIENLILYM